MISSSFFTSFLLAWIGMSAVCGANQNANSYNNFAMDASSEQYSSPSTSSLYADAKVPLYPDMSYDMPSNYPAAALPKYCTQPLYATQLYSGQNNYRQYDMPNSYSRMALPVVQSDPVANLYFPPGGTNSYGLPLPADPYSNSFNY